MIERLQAIIKLANVKKIALVPSDGRTPPHVQFPIGVKNSVP